MGPPPFATRSRLLSPPIFSIAWRRVGTSILSIRRTRSDLEEFTSQAVEEYYPNETGLKDNARISKVYDKFSHLFNQYRVESILR